MSNNRGWNSLQDVSLKGFGDIFNVALCFLGIILETTCFIVICMNSMNARVFCFFSCERMWTMWTNCAQTFLFPKSSIRMQRTTLLWISLTDTQWSADRTWLTFAVFFSFFLVLIALLSVRFLQSLHDHHEI